MGLAYIYGAVGIINRDRGAELTRPGHRLPAHGATVAAPPADTPGDRVTGSVAGTANAPGPVLMWRAAGCPSRFLALLSVVETDLVERRGQAQ